MHYDAGYIRVVTHTRKYQICKHDINNQIVNSINKMLQMTKSHLLDQKEGKGLNHLDGT